MTRQPSMRQESPLTDLRFVFRGNREVHTEERVSEISHWVDIGTNQVRRLVRVQVEPFEREDSVVLRKPAAHRDLVGVQAGRIHDISGLNRVMVRAHAEALSRHISRAEVNLDAFTEGILFHRIHHVRGIHLGCVGRKEGPLVSLDTGLNRFGSCLRQILQCNSVGLASTEQFVERFQIAGIFGHNELAALVERDPFLLAIGGQALIAEAGKLRL